MRSPEQRPAPSPENKQPKQEEKAQEQNKKPQVEEIAKVITPEQREKIDRQNKKFTAAIFDRAKTLAEKQGKLETSAAEIEAKDQEKKEALQEETKDMTNEEREELRQERKVAEAAQVEATFDAASKPDIDTRENVMDQKPQKPQGVFGKLKSWFSK